MTRLKRCGKCGLKVNAARISWHLRLTHGARSKEVQGHLRDLGSTRSTQAKLVLESRRGTRTYERGTCWECGTYGGVLWHYSKSSCGPVHLCSRCKGGVFNRSFGNVDAMTRAWSGGAFESSRRRH